MKIISALLFLILMTTSLVYAIDSEDYLNEFNEENEGCKIIDIFGYQISNYFTTPTFYYCSSESDSTLIIFDVYNQELLKDKEVSELIDLSYIKYNLNEGAISETHFISEGLDFCNYFGVNKLNKESINLVAQTAELASPLMSAKTAKDVSKFIKIGKSLGKISKLNPINLALSVGCKFNNDLLKESIESLIKCNLYLTNIKEGYANKGYTLELNNCIKNSKNNLKSYIDSDLSKIRDLANRGINSLSAAFNLATSIIKDPKSKPSLEIKETELDIARRIYQKLSNTNIYLNHPENSFILNKHVNRIKLKNDTYYNVYNLIVPKYQEVSELMPGFLNIKFTNLLFKPQYNITKGVINLKDAQFEISTSEELFKEYKFNSAIGHLNKSNPKINKAKEIILREISINRKIDRFRLILLILGGIIILYLIKRVL